MAPTNQFIRMYHATLDVDLTAEPLLAILSNMSTSIIEKLIVKLLNESPIDGETLPELLREVVEKQEHEAKERVLAFVEPAAREAWAREAARQRGEDGVEEMNGEGNGEESEEGGIVAEGIEIHGRVIQTRDGEMEILNEGDDEDEGSGKGSDVDGDSLFGGNDDGDEDNMEGSPKVDVGEAKEQNPDQEDPVVVQSVENPSIDIAADASLKGISDEAPSDNDSDSDAPGEADDDIVLPTPPASDAMTEIKTEEEQLETSASGPIELYCYCQRPVFDNMFGCDGPNCIHGGWFHEVCVKEKLLKKDWPKEGDGDWLCSDCAGYAVRKGMAKGKSGGGSGGRVAGGGGGAGKKPTGVVKNKKSAAVKGGKKGKMPELFGRGKMPEFLGRGKGPLVM